jgi:hypothetical protein
MLPSYLDYINRIRIVHETAVNVMMHVKLILVLLKEQPTTLRTSFMPDQHQLHAKRPAFLISPCYQQLTMQRRSALIPVLILFTSVMK